MQGTRRPHQKSRTGCTTCKQKKIKSHRVHHCHYRKCDEAKPSCQYCTGRSIQCTYPAPKSSAPSLAATTPDRRAPSSEVSTPPTSVIPPTIHIHPTFADAQWSLCDLELVHFYTASTSLTFSNVPERQHVWQYVVPQIAFSHTFLLHELLALAALHLSRTMPERTDSLNATASAHHAQALPTFRAAVESMSSPNSHACSAFGMMVAVYECASSGETTNPFFANTESPSEANSIEWIQLVRGSGKVITCYYEEITEGPLAPILRLSNTAELEADANLAESTKFAALEKLWDSTSEFVNAAEADSLNEALGSLRTIYNMVTLTSPEINDPASAALSWPVQVPDHYLLMVKQRQPVALVLLAHFCLLLNQIEDFWWIRGISRRLLQEIHQTLGAEWESWISWPLQDLILSEFRNQRSKEHMQS